MDYHSVNFLKWLSGSSYGGMMGCTVGVGADGFERYCRGTVKVGLVYSLFDVLLWLLWLYTRTGAVIGGCCQL